MKAITVNHFTSNRWKSGEVKWTFHLLPDDNLRSAAGKYCGLVKGRGLFSPVPEKWMHMTILSLGSSDVIASGEISKIVKLLRPMCARIRMPELTAGPWWVWDGSLVLQISPEPPIRQIFNAVMKASSMVLGGRSASHYDAFIPHMTLAYSNDYRMANEVKRRLFRLHMDTVQFRASELFVVEQRQTPPYYSWKVVAKIPLGNDIQRGPGGFKFFVSPFADGVDSSSEIARIHLGIRKWEEETGKNSFTDILSSRADLGSIRKYYLASGGNFFVAKDQEGKVVGFMGLKNDGNGQGTLKRLAVIPMYHHRGVARSLVRHAVSWAKSNGYSRLVLCTNMNEKSKFLFAQFGFKTTGFIESNRDCTMELILESDTAQSKR